MGTRVDPGRQQRLAGSVAPGALVDPGTIAFCRATQQSFLRLLTSAAVLAPYGNQPLTNSQAWDAYEALLADERITFAAEEPQGIATLWRDYGAAQRLVTEAVDGPLPRRLRCPGGVPVGDDGYRLPGSSRAWTSSSWADRHATSWVRPVGRCGERGHCR